MFDTFDMFVVCLARVWRVFGVLLAFVALFVSRKVFIVVGCVCLQDQESMDREVRTSRDWGLGGVNWLNYHRSGDTLAD